MAVEHGAVRVTAVPAATIVYGFGKVRVEVPPPAVVGDTARVVVVNCASAAGAANTAAIAIIAAQRIPQWDFDRAEDGPARIGRTPPRHGICRIGKRRAQIRIVGEGSKKPPS